MEWVLILTVLFKGSIEIHTQEFSSQLACSVAGVEWKKHLQEQLTKHNPDDKVVIVAGCTPKNIMVLPKSDNKDVI